MTTYSTNLDIALLDSNMNAPEDVVNAAIDAFDSKITGTVTCAFGSNTLTLTQDQQAVGSIFHLTVGSPGPTGACTLNFAAFGIGNFTAINDTGFAVTLQISGQSLTPPVLAPSTTAVFCCDGSNVRAPASDTSIDASAVSFTSAVSPSAPGSTVAQALDDIYTSLVQTLLDATRYDLALNFSGVPADGQVFTHIVGRPFKLPVSLTGSQAHIGTNPTSTLTATIAKNGSGIGSVAFSAGGVPTFTFSSQVSFAAADLITITLPNPADATGADIAITLLGTLT